MRSLRRIAVHQFWLYFQVYICYIVMAYLDLVCSAIVKRLEKTFNLMRIAFKQPPCEKSNQDGTLAIQCYWEEIQIIEDSGKIWRSYVFLTFLYVELHFVSFQ